MGNPNFNRLISFAILFVGAILFTLSCLCFGVEPIHPLTILSGAVPFAGVLFSWVTVRCPFCGHTLPTRCLWTSYCPHCGEKLD